MQSLNITIFRDYYLMGSRAIWSSISSLLYSLEGWFSQRLPFLITFQFCENAKTNKRRKVFNNDAHKTLLLHKADKELLESEIEILGDRFPIGRHPAQSEFIALNIWQFEEDHCIIPTL